MPPTALRSPLRLPPALITATLVATSLLLGGCESLRRTDSLFGVLTPYRIDIVQGNVVTKEQLAQLKPGMSRAQVRDVLGTPLLTDPFHAERWDYVFTIRRPGTPAVRRNVVVFFENDRMSRVDAPEEVPSEQEFVASISRVKLPPEPKKLALTEEERKALPAPRQDAAAPSGFEPQGPARDYPPLDSPS